MLQTVVPKVVMLLELHHCGYNARKNELMDDRAIHAHDFSTGLFGTPVLGGKSRAARAVEKVFAPHRPERSQRKKV